MRACCNDLTIVEEAFCPSEGYNASLVYTRSTGLKLTLQGATSFLQVLFPDAEAFFLVVFSVNMTIDFLLNTDPMPPVVLKRWLNDAGLVRELNPMVDAYFSWGELQAVAEEAYWSGGCGDYGMRWQCVLDLYDIGLSFQAVGRLKDKPKLAAALPGVIAVDVQYYETAFGYDASVELDRTEGTVAQNLAQEILGNTQAHLASPSYKLFEHSTHDSMVAPLGVTFGDQGDDTMLPPFGATYQVELLQDSGDNSYHIRVLRGSPQETTAGEYSYVDTGFTQRCINANGVEYIGAGNVCPLVDFIRLVDSTRPSVPNGFCIVDPALYDNMKCPPTVEAGLPVPYYCQIYRIACPLLSCPD